MTNTVQAAVAAAIAMRRRSDQGRSPALTDIVDAITAPFDVGDEVRTELAPQVVNVDLDRVAGDVILESIQLLLDLGACHEATGFAHQQLDHRVLACGEARWHASVGDDSLPQIEGHFTHG